MARKRVMRATRPMTARNYGYEDSVANKPDIRPSMLVDRPNFIIAGGCSDQIQSVQVASL
jgi:hypothetical protein